MSDTTTTTTPVLIPSCSLTECNADPGRCPNCNTVFDGGVTGYPDTIYGGVECPLCAVQPTVPTGTDTPVPFADATVDELRTALIAVTQRMASAAVEQRWCSEYETRSEEMAQKMPEAMRTDFLNLSRRLNLWRCHARRSVTIEFPMSYDVRSNDDLTEYTEEDFLRGHAEEQQSRDVTVALGDHLRREALEWLRSNASALSYPYIDQITRTVGETVRPNTYIL